MSQACPRCGSDKIIPHVPLLDHYGDVGAFSKPAQAAVHGNPEAWFFKESAAGGVSMRICGDCGHAELHVSNSRELYEKYLQSRGG